MDGANEKGVAGVVEFTGLVFGKGEGEEDRDEEKSREARGDRQTKKTFIILLGDSAHNH